MTRTNPKMYGKGLGLREVKGHSEKAILSRVYMHGAKFSRSLACSNC